MIFDVCNLSDKIGASLLPIYTCPVGQVWCQSLLPEPKSDCHGQSGNLIVAACVLSYQLQNEPSRMKVIGNSE